MLKDSPLLYYSVASSDFRGGNVMDRFEFTTRPSRLIPCSREVLVTAAGATKGHTG